MLGPSLGSVLDAVETLLVVRAPGVAPEDLTTLLDGVPHTQRSLTGTDPAPDAADAALLVARDALELRRVVAACQELPAATLVGCLLLDADRPPLTSGRPQWPAVLSVVAGTEPVAHCLVRLRRPLRLGALVAELARTSTPHRLMAGGRPALAVDVATPALWPPGDAQAVIGSSEELHDVSGDYPADVVVVEEPVGVSGRTGVEHPVVGRLAEDLPVRGTALELGGLDGRLLNPIGFDRRLGGPAVRLEPTPGRPELLRARLEDGEVVVDLRRGVTPSDVARLRGVAGVELGWPTTDRPHEHCRVVAGLALAGVPMTARTVPAWAAARLAPALVSALGDVSPLTDPMAREIRSIRQRRAAHAHHSAAGWRRQVAAAAGAQQTPRPRVSVLLPTRRPGMLGFALRQLARQREVDLEVLVAGHGHQPDPALLAASGLVVTGLAASADEPFGSVLNEAARRASGDVLLKMDDDDWYGPDFVSDLLLALDYSGADVVGSAPEFVYVEPLATTVRRKDVTERYRTFVAGGTLMITRQAFAAVGGFRHTRRYVDAGLLHAVAAAGGHLYRTHGHGYLLRRGAGGHTWDPGLGYFVSRSRTMHQWRGFRPSPLLEPDDQDRPDQPPHPRADEDPLR